MWRVYPVGLSLVALVVVALSLDLFDVRPDILVVVSLLIGLAVAGECGHEVGRNRERWRVMCDEDDVFWPEPEPYDREVDRRLVEEASQLPKPRKPLPPHDSDPPPTPSRD